MARSDRSRLSNRALSDQAASLHSPTGAWTRFAAGRAASLFVYSAVALSTPAFASSHEPDSGVGANPQSGQLVKLRLL